MQINTEFIVPAKELSLNTFLIKERLKNQDRIIVFEDNTPQFIIMPISATEDADEPTKIGEYVQATMKNLFSSMIISEEDINSLLSPKYSKSVLQMNFPILKEVDLAKPLGEQKRDSKGYNRYYNFTLSYYEKQYLLCSQWLERHYDVFEHWHQTILNK